MVWDHFLGGTLKKANYQTDFILVLSEGFPKIVELDLAILNEVLSIGSVTLELIDT